MASNIDLFFNTSRNKRTFPEVLAEIQEYLASKYSTLITDNPEEQHQQIIEPGLLAVVGVQLGLSLIHI